MSALCTIDFQDTYITQEQEKQKLYSTLNQPMDE